MKTVRLESLTEEEKLELALELFEEPVNQLETADDLFESYVNAAGPHGLPVEDLDDLIDWLSFGTRTTLVVR